MPYKSPLDLSNALIEQKVWKHPTFKKLQNNELLKGYNTEVVSIDDLIRDNDLDNPIAVNNHAAIWSPTGDEEDIHPDQFKYDAAKDTDPNDIIYGTRKLDGRVILSNGRHRTRALKNDGYTHLEIPIYKE